MPPGIPVPLKRPSFPIVNSVTVKDIIYFYIIYFNTAESSWLSVGSQLKV